MVSELFLNILTIFPSSENISLSQMVETQTQFGVTVR